MRGLVRSGANGTRKGTANFAETVDLGGASGAGQLWRAVTALDDEHRGM